MARVLIHQPQVFQLPRQRGIMPRRTHPHSLKQTRHVVHSPSHDRRGMLNRRPILRRGTLIDLRLRRNPNSQVIREMPTSDRGRTDLHLWTRRMARMWFLGICRKLCACCRNYLPETIENAGHHPAMATIRVVPAKPTSILFPEEQQETTRNTVITARTISSTIRTQTTIMRVNFTSRNTTDVPIEINLERLPSSRLPCPICQLT